MSIEQVVESYIGIGKVSARAVGTADPLRLVGNVSALSLQHNLDVKQQRDYMRMGGGTLKKVERIESIGMNTTWLSFNAENLAIATAGAMSSVASAVIATEAHKGSPGSTVVLAHPPRTITSVKDTTTPTAVTYDPVNAQGVGDYEKSAAGIWIPFDSDIPVDEDLVIAYTHEDYDQIEAGTKTSSLLYVLFEGLNEAESGDPVIVEAWRTSFPSVDELNLIGEDFGELSFQAEVLKDASKGAGVSAYYRVRKVRPVTTP